MFKKTGTAVCLLLAAGIIFADSMNLNWIAITDAANKGDSTCTVTVADETVAGTAYKNVVTMKGAVTTKYQYGFIGMSATDADAAIQEKFNAALKNGKGIKFKTTGDGRNYDCRVETNDRKDFCFHLFTFAAPKGTVAEIVIPYEKLKQYSWGAAKKFKKDLITTVSFQTIGQPISSVELKIWDLEVIN